MTHYIIEIIVFQAIFLSIYLIFLRKETFFQWNRAYLLITAVLAFILPGVELDIFATQVRLPQQIQELAPVFIGVSTTVIEPVTTESNTLPSGFWWVAAYAIGVVFSLGILFRKYGELQRYFRFQRKENPFVIAIPNSDAAFTFINTIFLGEKLNAQTRDHILAHEKVHVKEKHGLDLMFFELLKVFFWFNPLIYVYQKSISEVHEYLADAQASKTTEPRNYYNQLLNTAFGTHEISFINTFFNQSLIKKRIVMLHRNSKTTAKWKYALLIPVLAGMLIYVGCSSDENSTSAKENSLEEQIADLKTTLDARENISEEEKKKLVDLVISSAAKKPIVSVEKTPGRDQEIESVPFAVIEEVPVYPGCENLETNEEKKTCMSERVTEFVNKSFDTSLGKKLGMTGINKIYVQFKINEKGNVEFMGSRGPHPALEKEAERIVKLMPKMTPGVHGGEKVNVLYALPIVFNIQK